MEQTNLQTTGPQEIQQVQELQEARMYPGKLPLIKYLPENLKLPAIVKAEISQSMLKWSSEDDVNRFCAKICSLFNPKYTGSPEEKDALAELDFATAYAFAKNCELTAEEMELAFHLATEGKLKTEPDKDGNAVPVQLYREVDALKLGELKAAYIRHKASDKGYEIGKEKLKNFLEPPTQELTPEQKKAERIAFYKTELERLQNGEMVLGTTIFYELIKLAGLERISLKYVESVLDKFQPETFQSGISVTKVGGELDIPKKIKHNAKVFFIGEIVKSYFKKHNLKELTQDQFIAHWENIKNTTNV